MDKERNENTSDFGMKNIYLTKHAKDKITLLVQHGFNLDEEYIILAVKNSDKIFSRESQKMFLKIYDENHAIQIVGEEIENRIKIITLFPVRRRRYGI